MNPGRPLEILHLEDDVADAELTMETLRAGGLVCVEARVQTRAAFEAALARGRASDDRPPFDLVLADYRVPGFGGDEALEVARRLRPDLPFIVISGKVGEELAIAMLHAGATDYVLKQRLARLVPAVRRALHERNVERERRIAVYRLAELTSRLHEKTLLDQVLDQMPAGVMVARAPDGRIVALNAHAIRMFGAPGPFEWITDVARCEVHLPDGRRAGPDDLPSRRALASGELVRDLVLEFRHGGGRSVFAQVSSTPVRDEAGSVLGVVTTYTDVTASKEHEVWLRQQLDFREQLVGIVSHDLRSPLSAIQSSAYILSRASPNVPAAARAIENIERSVGRMDRLIRDLLDFAKTRLGGPLPIARRATDLRALTEGALEEARVANPQRVLELVSTGDAVANVDPDRLQQVLTNLIANALAYGAPDRAVRVTLGREDEDIVLQVSNEGPPIPPEMIPHLFQPFRRGPHPKGERNIGLGLYIVHQIVLAHGGSVDVHSSADGGTRFTMRIPSQQPRSAAAAVH